MIFIYLFIEIDIFSFQLNPEHTVPTLVDGEFVIWDSHAICMYLIEKYGKTDQLYPKDIQLRAKCNQRLFFDASSLFVRLRDCSVHVFFNGGSEIPQNKIDPMYSAFEILEAFLANDPFLVGKQLTIADISAAISVLVLEIYAPLQADKHPKIVAWLNRVKQTIPFFDDVNAKEVEGYRQLLHTALAKNKQK